MFRLLFLGGSTTVGVHCQLEETFPYRVGLALSQKFPKGKIEAINAAKTGKTSAWILRRFRETLSLRPDVAIIMTGYNDSALVYREKLHLGAEDIEIIWPWYVTMDRWFARYSVFYASLREKIAILLYRAPYYAFDRTIDSTNGGQLEQKVWFRVCPDYFRTNLEKIVHLAKTNKVDLIFIRPPLSNIRSEKDPLYKAAFLKLMDELVSIAQRFQIPIIDLRGVFPTANEKLYYSDGLHFTALGNQMIAEKITDYLMTHKEDYF